MVSSLADGGPASHGHGYENSACVTESHKQVRTRKQTPDDTCRQAFTAARANGQDARQPLQSRHQLRCSGHNRLMTREERIHLWSALSEVFVDNEVDYTFIARQVAGFDRAMVQAAFYEDVAPACYSNMLAPIPPIWTGFDSTWLGETIERAQAARQRSALRRLRDRLFIAYLRRALKAEWAKIAQELDRL